MTITLDKQNQILQYIAVSMRITIQIKCWLERVEDVMSQLASLFLFAFHLFFYSLIVCNPYNFLIFIEMFLTLVTARPSLSYSTGKSTLNTYKYDRTTIEI